MMHSKICKMSSEEYKSFCALLVDYADTHIREFIRLPEVIQAEAIERFELEQEVPR